MTDDTAGGAGPQGQEPSAEQIAQMMYERLAATPVPMVLAQTLATFTDLAAIRLGLGPEGDARAHAGEARLAIDVLGALMPIAEAALGPAQTGGLKEALAQLRMAFVERVQAEGPPPGSEGDAPPAPPPPPPPPPPGDSGLWVPPHVRR